jgi:hypothetical protein
MPISVEYYCNTCDEYKESEQIEIISDNDSFSYAYGSIVGNHKISDFESYCKDCESDIEIITDYFE